MNFSKLKRTFTRHTCMKDLPAYSSFLEYIDGHNHVWKATQSELAEWWEKRQSAKIQTEIIEPGRLFVSCPVEEVAIEIDGKELKTPPFEIAVSTNIPIGPLEINLSDEIPEDEHEFLNEILGHFGYMHVVHGKNPGISFNSIKRVLERLRHNAVKHWRFDEDDIMEFRNAVKAAHNKAGIPELRIWTMPRIGGEIQKVCVSARFDVDKAIINMPMIHDLEDSYGAGSTIYLRPTGYFYGNREIIDYLNCQYGHEVALHGEFVTTAENDGTDEFEAACKEKSMLEKLTGREIYGVCMHGGELRTNSTERTWKAIESAGFLYETHYRNQYYLPLHLPSESGIRKTLSIGQHFADISVKPGKKFAENFTAGLIERFQEARSVGGVLVPVMHPLYFSISGYIKRPENIWRLAAFIPKYLSILTKMNRAQEYSNRPE